MIPKKIRISRDSFEEISKGGKSVHSASISLKYLENKGETGKTESKMAVVVSKKVSKVSPKRNLIKRRINSVLNSQKNLIKHGFFMVFYVKPGALDKKFSETKEEVLFLLKKSGILV